MPESGSLLHADSHVLHHDEQRGLLIRTTGRVFTRLQNGVQFIVLNLFRFEFTDASPVLQGIDYVIHRFSVLL